MKEAKNKLDEIVQKKSHIATLRQMIVGETKRFAVRGIEYHALHNAKYRLKAKGYAYKFTYNGDAEILEVTRHS